jgi:hypothetical protein
MFIVLNHDIVAQIGDSVRISAVKTYAPKGSPAITKVEIEPEVGAGFVDVTGVAPINPKNWFLDWIYLIDGVKVGNVRVTQVGDIVTTKNFSLEVLTQLDDALYSTDNDLIYLEHDVLNYLPQGRTNYNYLHRKVQEQILDWLDGIRITRKDGSKLEKQDLNQVKDMKELSASWVLMNLFFELSNKNDDKFFEKHLIYKSKVESLKGRGRIQADLDQDGTPEIIDFKSFRMVRR